MNKHSDTIGILLGIITSTIIGSLLIQGLGAMLLGALGALGGFIFNKYLKKYVDTIIELIRGKDKA